MTLLCLKNKKYFLFLTGYLPSKFQGEKAKMALQSRQLKLSNPNLGCITYTSRTNW